MSIQLYNTTITQYSTLRPFLIYVLMIYHFFSVNVPLWHSRLSGLVTLPNKAWQFKSFSNLAYGALSKWNRIFSRSIHFRPRLSALNVPFQFNRNDDSQPQVGNLGIRVPA